MAALQTRLMAERAQSINCIKLEMSNQRKTQHAVNKAMIDSLYEFLREKKSK